MKRIKIKKGFTLIELLVVISIISLLSSVVLASVKISREKANYARVESDIHQIKIALSIYASDNNGNFPKASTNRSCIGANNCIYMGNTVSDSLVMLPDDNKTFSSSKIKELFVKMASAANIFPNFTNAPKITKADQIFKGYIYDNSACTSTYCGQGQAYIIYPGDPNDSNDPLTYSLSVGSFEKSVFDNPESSSGNLGLCTLEGGGNYLTSESGCGNCNFGTAQTQAECENGKGQCAYWDGTSLSFFQDYSLQDCTDLGMPSDNWVANAFIFGSWESCDDNSACGPHSW